MGCTTNYFGLAVMSVTEPSFSVGDRVRTREQTTSQGYDTGTVVKTEPGMVFVAWEIAEVSYWEDPFDLLPFAAQSISPARIIRQWSEPLPDHGPDPDPDPPAPKDRVQLPAVRCTRAERERWQAAAKDRGTNLSALIRSFLESLE